MQIIIFPTDENRVAVLSPAPDMDLTEVAEKDVPEGKPWRIIDSDDLPAADAWLWADEGPIVPYVDPATILATFTDAIDAHIEAQARAWSYNSAAHLASYVASTVPQWAAEAQAFVAWRDAVWLAALTLLADVQAGEAEPPADPAAFIATLPALVRPTE